MLENLNLPTLKSKRNRAKLQMIYEVTNNLVCIPNVCLIPIPPFLRNGYYNQLDTKIDNFKFSFFSLDSQAIEFNPPYIVNSPTFDQFCTHLDNYTCAL